MSIVPFLEPQPKRYVSQWAIESPMARFVKRAGSLSAGHLLAQIVFWYLPGKSGKSKLRAFKLGYWWIAKSREEWMFETGLTLEEYKLAVRKLEALKAIEVKQMPWSGDGGLTRYNLTHIRLLDKTVLSLAAVGQNTPPRVGQNTPPRVGQNTPPRVVGITPPCTTENTTESTTENVLPVLGNVDQDQRSTETLNYTGEEPEGRVKEVEEVRSKEEDIAATMTQSDTKRWRMKASDVLKAHHGPTEGSLGAFWKSRCTLVLGSFQRALTGKECGQLKQLHKYLGPDTRPVIDYAINHWWKFASRAGASAGVTFPAEPHIGFLLKYHGVAMNLLKPEAQTPSPPVVEAPVQLIANTDTEPVHELTSQELTELLDGLKSP